jgi:hypothetical protein
MDESLYNFDKYEGFVCFEGSVFGRRRSIQQLVGPVLYMD